MARLYTRTGDTGSTGLGDGRRLAKSAERVAALGDIDETNACLGVARIHTAGDARLDPLLERLQNLLFDLGTDIACPGMDRRIGSAQIAALEGEIDRLDGALPALTAFILPGGTPAAAALHLARTVCRRAERSLVRLGEAPDDVGEPGALMFLNRLSDLLFAAARTANRAQGDVLWRPGQG